jgi:DNA-directed RNA polymerase subunit F
MTHKVVSESATNAAEVKKMLESIKERDKELGFRAQRTLDHLESIGTLSQKKAKELETALAKLEIPRMKESHIHKLIDVLPKTADEVKLILQGYALTVTNENCKKIADTIAEIAK